MIRNVFAFLLGMFVLIGCAPKKPDNSPYTKSGAAPAQQEPKKPDKGSTAKTGDSPSQQDPSPKPNRTPVKFSATELLKNNKADIEFLFKKHAQDIIEISGVVDHFSADFWRDEVVLFVWLATNDPKEQLPCPLGKITTNPYDQLLIGQSVVLRSDLSQFDSLGVKPWRYEVLKAEGGEKPMTLTAELLAKRLEKLEANKKDESLIGKGLYLTGKLTSIQKSGGFSGTVTLEMSQPDNPIKITCSMLFPTKSDPMSDPERFGKVGNTVTVYGKVSGNSRIYAMLDDCVLASPK